MQHVRGEVHHGRPSLERSAHIGGGRPAACKKDRGATPFPCAGGNLRTARGKPAKPQGPRRRRAHAPGPSQSRLEPAGVSSADSPAPACVGGVVDGVSYADKSAHPGVMLWRAGPQRCAGDDADRVALHQIDGRLSLFTRDQRRKRQIKQPVVEREQPARFVPITRLDGAEEHPVQLSSPAFGRRVSREKGLTEPARLAQNDCLAGEAVKRQAGFIGRPKP